jgi:hypothetical protein
MRSSFAETTDHPAIRCKPQGLGERHLHLPAVGERSEHPVRLGLMRHRQREREALEAGPFLAATVGGHHRGLADAKARMHDLVLRTGRHHAGWRRLRVVLEAHEHRHLGAEHAAVELDCFLAVAVEEQIGLDVHDISFSGLRCP